MRDLECHTVEDLMWSHYNREQELKYFEANPEQASMERGVRISAVIIMRDQLWAEIERRMERIPSAKLEEAINGEIKLVII